MKLIKRKLNVTRMLVNVLPIISVFVSGYTAADPSRGGCMLVDFLTQTNVAPGTAVKVNFSSPFFDETSIPSTPSGACDSVNSQITVPTWAHWVKVTGHITFPGQSIGSGHLSIHLFRNVHGASSTTSTPALTSYGMNWAGQLGPGDQRTPEAHYHNRSYYPNETSLSTGASSGHYYSILATTDWIPVFAIGESWTVYAYQDATCTGSPCTGPSVQLLPTAEQWIRAEFSATYPN